MKLVYPPMKFLNDPNLSRTQEIMRQFAVARARAIESVLLDAAAAYKVQYGRFPLYVVVDETQVDRLKWEITSRATNTFPTAPYPPGRRNLGVYKTDYLNAVEVSE